MENEFQEFSGIINTKISSVREEIKELKKQPDQPSSFRIRQEI